MTSILLWGVHDLQTPIETPIRSQLTGFCPGFRSEAESRVERR